MTAGQIIPAVTGTTWDDYVRQRIFTPLGMNHTDLSTTAYKPGGDYAYPHSRVDGKLQVIPFEDLDNAGPAGSINSCAADMAKWVQLQLNRGKFVDHEGRLFSEQRSKEMWSPQTILPIGDPPAPLAGLKTNFADYALGWGLRDYHGRKLVGHTGGVAGFVSRVMLVPEENLGVVILTNAEEGGAFDSILYHVLDHYFSLPPTDWIAAFKAAEGYRKKRMPPRQMKKAEERPRREFQAFPAPREIRRRLQRCVVWTHHHPLGKRWPGDELRSHARHDRRPAALAIRHIQSALARAHHRRRIRDVLSEPGRSDR